MAPRAAVERLLRVCNPDGTLPVTAALDEPLPEHSGWVDARLSLQLVTQPR